MPSSTASPEFPRPLSALDFHVLLVLAAEKLYGYAIMKAVEEHSGRLITPEIGSLYRVLARLMDAGWVEEVPTDPSIAKEGHRGRPRRYYGITSKGVEVAQAERRRLKRVIALADSTMPEAAG